MGLIAGVGIAAVVGLLVWRRRRREEIRRKHGRPPEDGWFI